MIDRSSFDHWKSDDDEHAAMLARTDQLRATVADEVNKGRLVFACVVVDNGEYSNFESISVGSASTPELLMFATTVMQMANKLLQDVLQVCLDDPDYDPDFVDEDDEGA